MAPRSATVLAFSQDALAPDLTPSGPGPIRHLDATGRLTPAGERAGVDLDLAQELWREMVLARALDREAVALQRQGELSLWLQCEGQEAAQVGSVRALAATDHVFPSYREHAVGLSRGLSPAELLTQWRGVAHAGWDSERYRYHVYSLVLGTQTLHAAGYALGCRMDGAQDVVVVYFGDGAASQGDVSEALNWAATMRLPMLFVCQNNQWAISTPTDLQSSTPVHRRAEGFGLRSFWVDGNDALAMHAVTTAAVEGIRRGEGPALIEAETYRVGGHSTSDDPTRYRTAEEVESWRHRDPVSRLEALLRGSGVAETFFDSVAAEADALRVRTREECRALQAPDLADLFDEVYAEPHPALAAQRERLLAHRRAVGAH